tara:strand:+ start:573 stop:770 length:198 start_codon:yes stop_codon:yes gene_type:complete
MEFKLNRVSTRHAQVTVNEAGTGIMDKKEVLEFAKSLVSLADELLEVDDYNMLLAWIEVNRSCKD